MNSQQKIVFWMGFILIVARFFGTGQFKAIWSTVTTGAASATGVSLGTLSKIPAQPQQGPSPSAPGGSGTINIPGLGNVPYPYMNTTTPGATAMEA